MSGEGETVEEAEKSQHLSTAAKYMLYNEKYACWPIYIQYD